MKDEELTDYANRLLKEMKIDTPARVSRGPIFKETFRGQEAAIAGGDMSYDSRGNVFEITISSYIENSDIKPLIDHECGHIFVQKKMHISPAYIPPVYVMNRTNSWHAMYSPVYALMIAGMASFITDHPVAGALCILGGVAYVGSFYANEALATKIGSHFSKRLSMPFSSAY